MKKQSPPTLAIRLSDDDRQLLNDIAVSAGISASHLIRIVAREGHNLFNNLPALIEKYPPIYRWSNKACSGFAAGRVKNKGSAKAANR